MITLEQMKKQVEYAEVLEELATKFIETLDMEILGEYGEMYPSYRLHYLPDDFEPTENMKIASKFYLVHKDKANKAYHGY